MGKDLLIAISLGFSAALLGISGFESSANFVEEQDVGVFRKTLRNMLIAVAVFNPLVSILSLNLLPLAEIVGHKDYLLSEMAHLMAGQTFKVIIVLDATLVLSGAVLTSYVGVTGLVHRMAFGSSSAPVFLEKKPQKYEPPYHYHFLSALLFHPVGYQGKFALPGRGLHNLFSGCHDPFWYRQYPSEDAT